MKLLRVLASVVAMLLTLTALTSATVAPASAGDGVKKAVKSWHQLSGGQVYLKSARMCARWTFNASWKVNMAVDNNQEIWSFENPRVLDPNLTVKFFKNCKSDKKRRTSKVTAKTYLSASNFSLRLCSLNPSISVGVPWTVTVGAAPTCDDDSRRASRTRTVEPTKPTHKVQVASTGKRATWEDFEWYHNGNADDDKKLRACFRLRTYLDVQSANGELVDDAFSNPVTPNFCLPVGSWAVALSGRS